MSIPWVYPCPTNRLQWKNEEKNDTKHKQIVLWCSLTIFDCLWCHQWFWQTWWSSSTDNAKMTEWLPTCLCRVGAKNICQNWKSDEQRIRRGKHVYITFTYFYNPCFSPTGAMSTGTCRVWSFTSTVLGSHLTNLDVLHAEHLLLLVCYGIESDMGNHRKIYWMNYWW